MIRRLKNLSPAEEERRIARAKKHYAAMLQRLAASNTSLSPAERRVLALFPPGVSRATLLAASDQVRFQRGLADRFKDGYVRSGRWMPHIRKVFRERGLPEQLGLLPHVESSFNPLAYSHAAAAGLWQFMPSTGARYMRIDRAVDERYDPWRSTEGAAALMRDNYRTTGSWPLAITKHRPSIACWRHATTFCSLTVGQSATWMCSRDSCSAWRASGMKCSQHTSAPTLPAGVSTARRPAPSPGPHTRRSV